MVRAVLIAAVLPAGACARANSPPVLKGICEASAVVPWEGGWLVGDNEDERALHAYDADLKPKGTVALPYAIEDVEALALDGGTLWVVGSQSDDKKGGYRPLRHLLGPLGQVPREPDVSGCAACAATMGRAPKRGGFSVEGAMVFNGDLWLGVRSPLVDGKAILLQLDAALKVARMVTVDLGGAGVRDLVAAPGVGFYALAGPLDDNQAPGQVWASASPGAVATKLGVAVPAHAEGLALVGDGTALIVTDGDGEPGSACAKPATWVKVRLP